MLIAKGFEFTIEVHEKELRLRGNMLADKRRIDPVIPFEDIVGFDSGRASGYNFVHIRTWNPEGYFNYDMNGTGMISSLQNRNYVIYHMWFQRKAYKLVCEELRKIVDNNKEAIEAKLEAHLAYQEERRAKMAHLPRVIEVQKPRTFYGIWINWN